MDMFRSIEHELKQWKDSPSRYPLLLRGARQVGKSYVIEKFGLAEFSSFAMVNFEAEPEAHACFETLEPREILQRLELVLKKPIIPGKTLLFLDEIQSCPKAILGLRYFKEKMPDLHVIGAGSLLEFTLIQGKFSFPVGRVQFMYLRPLSFREFLLALNDSDSSHQKLLQRVREYFLTGGMPAVVEHFRLTQSFLQTTRIQDLLLATYQADFGKYATESDQKYLRILFENLPSQIAKQFKYSKIDPHMRSRELKSALDQLQWAGLIYPVVSSSCAGIPLSMQTKQNRFKLLFLDIGLVQCALKIDPEAILSEDLVFIHQGALVEQFVGQELLAYADFFREEKLYFWEREKAGSDAEVDYVITVDNEIIPIEVKAGKTGRLKSLRQFMEEKNSLLGIRISQSPLSFENKILSVPLYMIDQIPRLVRECKKSNISHPNILDTEPY